MHNPREVLPRKSLKKKNLILSAPLGPAYEFMSLNQVKNQNLSICTFFGGIAVQ